MVSLNKIQKYKKYKNTKVLITQPFFELQTPDFAQNTKVQKVKKYKKYKNTKVQKFKKRKK